MTREQKIREARRLRALGWTAPAIGKQLGVAESTIRNWYLGGACSDCGGPISYYSATDTPTRCVSCSKNQRAAQHGTTSKYSGGCRCDACRGSQREHMRSLKGLPAPRHGYSGYSNYGCRCDQCCNANLAYNRAIGWKHQKAWVERKRGTEPPQHGTLIAYNKYACRCEECRAAGSEYGKRRRRARAAS